MEARALARLGDAKACDRALAEAVRAFERRRPEDGATIAIAGLHRGEDGTIMHLLATAITTHRALCWAQSARLEQKV